MTETAVAFDKIDFSGVWTAVATPFSQDLSIDWNAFTTLLSKQENAGVKGVVVCGTTGEAPALTTEEKLALVRKARSFLSDSVRVMAGTGGNNTQTSVELSKLAEEAGADSVLIVTPPYNKPSTAGLEIHYKAVADAVAVPVCLYHVPGRTAHHLSVGQLSKLCELPGVACVKEASADIGFFSRALQSSDAQYVSGDDPTYLASLAVGGVGAISVVSNIFPDAMVELTEAVKKGDLGRARHLHNILLPAIDSLFCEVNPSPLKAALEVLGLGENLLRPPLAPVTNASYELIKLAITTAKTKLDEGVVSGG